MVPLMRLTRKNSPWNWSLACDKAFNLLKSAFTTAPILVHFDPALPPVVETDASDYAIAGIFSVRTDDGKVHPVAFYSRTLQGAELNYDTHDKELLAIFEAFKIWRHYLESPHHTIDVITNHKNLEYFTSTKVLTRRQARWSVLRRNTDSHGDRQEEASLPLDCITSTETHERHSLPHVISLSFRLENRSCIVPVFASRSFLLDIKISMYPPLQSSV